MLRTLRSATRTAAHYLRYHPEIMLVFGRHALARRVAIPLDVLRWALDQMPRSAWSPEAIILSARPPGLALDLTLSLMGNNRLQIGATMEIASIVLGPERLELTLDLRDLEVEALTPESPMGKMLASGFIDLSQPAKLLSVMPSRPDVIVHAEGQRFVLELMKVPKIARNQALRRSLSALSPLVRIEELRTEGDWLVLELRAQLRGIVSALNALRLSQSPRS